MRDAYSILVGMREGKKPSGSPRSEWGNNITVGSKEIGMKKV
jgi:hypothetical protein